MITKEKRHGAYIGALIGFLVGLALFLLSGCTTYKIIRHPDGSVEVDVSFLRDFKDMALKYSRDGEVVHFEFGAASVVSQTPIDAAIEGIKFGVEIATGRSVSDNEQE